MKYNLNYFYFNLKLLKEIGGLIKKILFEGHSDLAQIQNLFAESSLQANLKNLLSKLLAEKVPLFKKIIVDNESICSNNILNFTTTLMLNYFRHVAKTGRFRLESRHQNGI